MATDAVQMLAFMALHAGWGVIARRVAGVIAPIRTTSRTTVMPITCVRCHCQHRRCHHRRAPPRRPRSRYHRLLWHPAGCLIRSCHVWAVQLIGSRSFQSMEGPHQLATMVEVPGPITYFQWVSMSPSLYHGRVVGTLDAGCASRQTLATQSTSVAVVVWVVAYVATTVARVEVVI